MPAVEHVHDVALVLLPATHWAWASAARLLCSLHISCSHCSLAVLYAADAVQGNMQSRLRESVTTEAQGC